jgi:probable addiction module antidote protein
MTLKTTPLDLAELLQDDEDIRVFLEETAKEGTPEDFIRALGTAARAKGMTEIAKEAGVTRASLYKSLSSNGNPEFSTVAKVVRALGLRITVVHV